MIIPLAPARVRTEASFTAEDPWNQNYRATFTIEAYVLAVPGTIVSAGTKSLSGYLYGIRSELDSQERMLPEALSELWRTNRIAAENLPRLLKLMQPKLKAWDYRPVLNNKMAQVLEYIKMILFVLLSLMPIVVAKFSGEIPMEDIVWMVPLLLGIGALGMYLVFYRKKAPLAADEMGAGAGVNRLVNR